jgi:hypothetical protein
MLFAVCCLLLILVLLLLMAFAYRFSNSYILGVFGFQMKLWIANKVCIVKQNRAGAEFELSRHPKICQSMLSAGRAIHGWKSKIM